MGKYSVLLEVTLEAESHDELNEKVERLTKKYTRLLKQAVKPYGYYQYPCETVQTTFD